MDTAAPDTSLDTPRFIQIVNQLRGQILDGSLAEHDALPSERSIAETQSVSRMTARRALDTLEAEGLVYSSDRRGRFVSPKRVTYDVSNMVSFVADTENRGETLGIEVVRAGKRNADGGLASKLDVRRNAWLFEYTRLFCKNGHAIFVETEYVVAARCPGFLRHDLHQSTSRILETHYDQVAHSGDIVIRMRGAEPEEMKLLGLGPRQAGIELTQIVRDADGKPISYSRQFWRGELAEFSARTIVVQKE